MKHGNPGGVQTNLNVQNKTGPGKQDFEVKYNLVSVEP